MMTDGRCVGWVKRLTWVAASGMVGLLALTPTSVGSEAAAPTQLADWSREVWETARGSSANRSDTTLNLLENPPAADARVGDVTTALEQRKENTAAWEAKRRENIVEVQTQLAQSIDKGDLRPALKHANEWYALATDKNEVLHDPRISELTKSSETAAREAEAAGRWLEAQSLYSRLWLLYEEEGRFKEDTNRLGQRLLMLRLYVPERLHEMKNAERVAEGDEPLPPFNKAGEDWHEKLAGIREDMVVQAIAAAGKLHVEKTPMGDILNRGLDALRTMVTTVDLKDAFPGVADKDKRDRFLSELDTLAARFKSNPQRADFRETYNTLRRILQVNRETVAIADEAVLHEFGNGAASALDEFSDFIWPDELARFQKTTEGDFPGVGVHITLDDALQLKVVSPVADTPAARAGVRANDLIRKINGESTVGIALQQAVDRITGPVGSQVTLSIERDGTEGLIDLTMNRARIPIYSVKGWKRQGEKESDWDYFIDHPNKIGYLRVSQFARNTSSEMRSAITRMRRDGLNGLIIDLRYNPGGLLDEAVNVSNLFVGQNVMIVSQEDNAGHQQDEHRASGRPMLGDVPLVVLVNSGSASASEIVAGCLQDHKRAVLVGERSFGKGSVQNVFPLGDGSGAFKLTTQYYKLPNGRLIHRREGQAVWGIEPDVRVTMLPKQIEESLKLRLDADVPPVPGVEQVDPNGKPIDPDRLLTEGIDPQLEAAVLLLKSQAVALKPAEPASAAAN